MMILISCRFRVMKSICGGAQSLLPGQLLELSRDMSRNMSRIAEATGRVFTCGRSDTAVSHGCRQVGAP